MRKWLPRVCTKRSDGSWRAAGDPARMKKKAAPTATVSAAYGKNFFTSKVQRSDCSHRGLVSLINPMIVQMAPSITKKLKKVSTVNTKFVSLVNTPKPTARN